jgi:hypothetical protein
MHHSGSGDVEQSLPTLELLGKELEFTGMWKK